MSTLLLLEENVRSLKGELRRALPRIGSGHLSEALAAALGSRTHASLLSRLRADGARSPEYLDLDAFAFRARLAALTAEPVEHFTLLDLARSKAIPVRPYVEFAFSDRSEESTQYEACSRHGLPLVTVVTTRALAWVEWDCITTPLESEGRLFGEDGGASLARNLFLRFEQLVGGHQGRPTFSGHAFTGRAEGLVAETARVMAEHFFGILLERSRSPGSRCAV